jgi:hypothetical protein
MRTRGLLVSALLLLLPALASAGAQNIPCREPFVFSGAAVNVVVLPYAYSVPAADSADTGRQLSVLVQLETLRAIARFGSVGAVQLVGSAEECAPEAVLAKLLGQQGGASAQVTPGHGLVLVWGRVYQEDEDIYVQTFVRFLRRGVDEEAIEIPLGDRRLAGKLSAQAFACPPRRITVGDLLNVQEQFARSARLHDRPDRGAPGREISQDAPVPYWVSDIRGEWMHIEGSHGGPRGWILAGTSREDWALGKRMPELSYIQGIVGYLRNRVAPGTTQTAASAASLRSADDALRDYVGWSREREGGAGDPPEGVPPATALAEAVQMQLRGVIRLLGPDVSTAEVTTAWRLFEQAAGLVPYSADAKNLEIVARLLLAYGHRQQGVRSREAAGELMTALGAEPGNATVLRNLETVHELLLAAEQPPATGPMPAAEREKLQQQLETIRVIRKRMAAPGR